MKIVDTWLDWYKINRQPSTWIDASTSIKPILEFAGFDWTPQKVEAYKAKRIADGISKRTINKELTYLSSLLKFAGVTPFPIQKFEKRYTQAPQPALPSPAEIEAIIQAIEPEYRPILVLMYDTGLRKSEALSLKAEDIYLDRGLFRVLGKGNKERLVPITTDRLRKCLSDALQGATRGYLFISPMTGRPYTTIRKPLERAAEKAGVKVHVYHHLFRHGFGTYGLAAGISMRALQIIMGHSDIKTTERYNQILGSFILAEGAKFNAYIK